MLMFILKFIAGFSDRSLEGHLSSKEHDMNIVSLCRLS